MTSLRKGGPSRSHPTASGPGARGPGPAESGLITYSVLQVLGLAFATATPLAAAVAGGRPHSGPTGTSFSSLPQLELEAAEAAAGLSRDTGRRTLRLRLLPAAAAAAGPDSRSRFSIRVPGPDRGSERGAGAKLGTRAGPASLSQLGSVWTGPTQSSRDSDLEAPRRAGTRGRGDRDS